ncbi:MAG: bifunctional adenosylcobinamide kinase/adenosylcobinamide-phosphate guanylyltransferase [Treponema sp.]|jgi:adenosylcobinamide kinase/adenosylcobinamide-phosphate guanylyltransferase|nr:bifunctional adenosylcobinamide kinase/adenosylcobinamide-phosphate guanylyltransferase [Treponema sp.]
MILIFGGAYQGKLACALERFRLTESDVYRCSIDDVDMPVNRRIIYEIDKWILALIKKDVVVEEAVSQFITANKEAIIISNDISCGVVPVDPVLRKWREAVGKTLTALSRNSDEVIRLFCGIQTRIK